MKNKKTSEARYVTTVLLLKTTITYVVHEKLKVFGFKLKVKVVNRGHWNSFD